MTVIEIKRPGSQGTGKDKVQSNSKMTFRWAEWNLSAGVFSAPKLGRPFTNFVTSERFKMEFK